MAGDGGSSRSGVAGDLAIAPRFSDGLAGGEVLVGVSVVMNCDRSSGISAEGGISKFETSFGSTVGNGGGANSSGALRGRNGGNCS